MKKNTTTPTTTAMDMVKWPQNAGTALNHIAFILSLSLLDSYDRNIGVHLPVIEIPHLLIHNDNGNDNSTKPQQPQPQPLSRSFSDFSSGKGRNSAPGPLRRTKTTAASGNHATTVQAKPGKGFFLGRTRSFKRTTTLHLLVKDALLLRVPVLVVSTLLAGASVMGFGYAVLRPLAKGFGLLGRGLIRGLIELTPKTAGLWVS